MKQGFGGQRERSRHSFDLYHVLYLTEPELSTFCGYGGSANDSGEGMFRFHCTLGKVPS